jgi:hypothetical protein
MRCASSRFYRHGLSPAGILQPGLGFILTMLILWTCSLKTERVAQPCSILILPMRAGGLEVSPRSPVG